jgi:hypothetical protein
VMATTTTITTEVEERFARTTIAEEKARGWTVSVSKCVTGMTCYRSAASLVSNVRPLARSSLPCYSR